jgi:hypothetical protein
MDDLQSRLLPRLVLDTVSCLWVAHDHVQEDLKNETRSAIAWLRNTDLTNSDRAAGVMCAVADHLRWLKRTCTPSTGHSRPGEFEMF